MNSTMATLANKGENDSKTPEDMYYCSTWLNGKHDLNIFLSALDIILSITAFLGNGVIIVALRKVSSLHTSSKLLLRCLAITDLCVGVILQPIYITYLFSPEHTIQCYCFKTMSYIVAVIFCGVSLFTLTAISVDRLLALMLGLRYKHVVTLKRVQIFEAVFWFSSTASAMTYLYSEFVTVIMICTGLFLCIVTSTFCYAKIYYTLSHHQTQVQANLHQGEPNGGRILLNIARYRKSVHCGVWIQMTLIACYLPFGIMTLVTEMSYLDYTPSLALVWELSLCILELNSSLNPMLYCWKIKNVRQAVKDTIRQWLWQSS